MIWHGIKNWFRGRQFKKFNSGLADINRTAGDLLKRLNDKDSDPTMVKYEIRKKLDILKACIDLLEEKYTKLKLDQETMTFITTRKPDETNKLKQKIEFLITSIKGIYLKLKDQTIKERDKKDIITKLESCKGFSKELKKLVNIIDKSFKPRKFNKALAVNPHRNVQEAQTNDQYSISKIIKVARGLGFNSRPGGRHRVTIDLQDGQPCALETSTSYIEQVRSRIAKASGLSNNEVDKYMLAV